MPEPAIPLNATVVRTSVVQDEAGRWLVRVRVENQARNINDQLFVGPFKSQADADSNGREIAKLVRKALGIADA